MATSGSALRIWASSSRASASTFSSVARRATRSSLWRRNRLWVKLRPFSSQMMSASSLPSRSWRPARAMSWTRNRAASLVRRAFFISRSTSVRRASGLRAMRRRRALRIVPIERSTRGSRSPLPRNISFTRGTILSQNCSLTQLAITWVPMRMTSSLLVIFMRSLPTWVSMKRLMRPRMARRADRLSWKAIPKTRSVSWSRRSLIFPCTFSMARCCASRRDWLSKTSRMPSLSNRAVTRRRSSPTTIRSISRRSGSCSPSASGLTSTPARRR